MTEGADFMARQIDQPVLVTLVHDADWNGLRPSSFRWRNQVFPVTAVLDCWSEIGRWWDQESPGIAWRLQLKGGGVCEVIQLQTDPPQWRLMVIYD
jgi:hypothetical protein